MSAIKAVKVQSWDSFGAFRIKRKKTIFSKLDLTFLKVTDGFIVVLQLQVTLAKEEMGLDRLAVQLQCSFTISQGLVMLLQLHMAQGPVGVVHCHWRVAVLEHRVELESDTGANRHGYYWQDCLTATTTHDSFAVARCSLLVLPAQEQSVSLLLQLLRGGALLRAAGHLLHRLRGARLALLPYPVPRLFGWIADRFKKGPSYLVWVGYRSGAQCIWQTEVETSTPCVNCNAPPSYANSMEPQ